MVVLDVRGITRQFNDFTAVDRVSFQVERGQICGFIGPNGAGKTTTMRIISTLDLPTTGDVFLNGDSVLDEPRKVRQQIGFMPDAYGNYGNTTVSDYLDFFARAHGLRSKRRQQALQYVTEFTGLGPLLEKDMSALSKGMRQRLCLAKTLLHDPELLILDEPAAGLDPRARIELRELVRALADMGKAVLISSHILSELAEICTHVAVIEAGVIRASGPVEQIEQDLRANRDNGTEVQNVFVRTLARLEDVRRLLLEQPHVGSVHAERDGLIFQFKGNPTELAALLAELVHRKMEPVEFASQATNLEDLFMSLTEGQLQ